MVRQVNYFLSTFRIDLAAAKPENEYSTIYIRGKRADLGTSNQERLEEAVSGPIKLLRVAQTIDFDNINKEDIAHVFSGEIGSPTGAGFTENLALTIAHQAGHSLVLQHVDRGLIPRSWVATRIVLLALRHVKWLRARRF